MRRRLQVYSWLTLLLLLASTGCTTSHPAPKPRPQEQRPLLTEEDIPAFERPRIAIIDLDETADRKAGTVTLRGTLVNRGSRATRQVYVRVHALNQEGDVVLGEDSTSATQVIAPGATGSFSLTLDDRADVDRYHVEAFVR